jgi:cell division protein FtsB
MNKKAKINQIKQKVGKLTSFLVNLLIFYFAIDVIILDDYSIVKWLSTKHELKKLKQEVVKTQQENIKLSKDNKRLENDPQAIETIAREKYGMKKPGEQVYRFVNDEDDKKKEGK